MSAKHFINNKCLFIVIIRNQIYLQSSTNIQYVNLYFVVLYYKLVRLSFVYFKQNINLILLYIHDDYIINLLLN